MALYQHGLVAALGVFLVVIGVVIPKLIEWQVRDALRAALTIDGTSDSGYNDWKYGTSGVVQRRFTGYELTNPVQFIGGAAPNFQEWSEDQEVWYELTRVHENANFSADRSTVQAATKSTYTLKASSPGVPTKYMLTVNWAFLTIVKTAGSEAGTWALFANVMMGAMFTTNLAFWAGNPTYCYLGTVCGLAKYNADGNSIPTLSATQLGQIAAKLPTVSWIGEYATIVPVIYNPGTDGPTQAAYIAIANAKFPWFDFTGAPNDPLFFLQYLSSLMTNTATTLTATYGTTPYGLFFKNATLHDHVFGIDPLLALLGQSQSIVTNNSVYLNTIKTGYNNDNLLGMDYFTQSQSRFNETRYPRGSFSVEGRQTSIPPFQSRPESFQFFFPTAMRFLYANFSHDGSVKRVPTWNFRIDTERFLAVDPDYGTKVEGLLDFGYISSGAPIWASKPRLAGVDPLWTAKITGVPAVSDSGESFLKVEGVTGAAVEGAAKLLFHAFANFTAYPLTGWSAQNGKAFALPMFQVVDYRVMSDSTADKLYSAVVFAPRIQRIVLMVLVIVGAVLIGAALLTYVYVLYVSRDGEFGEADALEQVKVSGTDTEMGATTDQARGGDLGSGSAPNPLEGLNGPVMPRPTAGEGY